MMRTILDLCIRMDELSHASYSAMAEHSPNPDLAEIFRRMAVEEKQHIGWWTDLANAWDQGLVPDVVNDTEGLERHMRQLLQEMQATCPDDFSAIPDDNKLDIAARLEFFMLDPIFGELLDIAEPGGARVHRESYARHLERVIGAIEMFYSRGDLARFLARVLRRAWRDNLALAAFATRDPLTALYNRRGLMAHLEQWRSWAQRYDRPLGVLLIDVDDFKAINDRHGHTVGDLALKTVAEALEQTIRGSDMVARYGGDEFAVVAPETATDELAALANRLVQAVRGANLHDWDGSSIDLSISVGGVIVGPQAAGTVDAMLAVADQSLYSAKRHGKNRIGEIAEFTPEAVANPE